GIHLMAQCPRGNQRFNTHDALVLNYTQMLREAGFLTRTEPQNEFIHIDGTDTRPDYMSATSREAEHVSTSQSLTQHFCATATALPRRQVRRQANVNRRSSA